MLKAALLGYNKILTKAAFFFIKLMHPSGVVTKCVMGNVGRILKHITKWTRKRNIIGLKIVNKLNSKKNVYYYI